MSLRAMDQTQPGDQIVVAIDKLATTVVGQLAESMRSLDHADIAAADSVVRHDLEINRSRYQIEEAVASELLAGVDADRLRLLVAVINVISDLERIGDHAEGIAKIALMLGRPPIKAMPAELRAMGEQVNAMLQRAWLAFRTRNAVLAMEICQEDDGVDDLYESIYSMLIASMGSDPHSVLPNTYLLWATHNLERIADRVTNLCERTVYLTTGKVEELNVSNY